MAKGVSKYDHDIPRVLTLLNESAVPLLISDISRALGILRFQVKPILNLMKYRHLGVVGRQLDKGYFYTTNEAKFPKKIKTSTGHRVRSIFIPDGLYRGWYNPDTGLTGTRLGV